MYTLPSKPISIEATVSNPVPPKKVQYFRVFRSDENLARKTSLSPMSSDLSYASIVVGNGIEFVKPETRISPSSKQMISDIRSRDSPPKYEHASIVVRFGSNIAMNPSYASAVPTPLLKASP